MAVASSGGPALHLADYRQRMRLLHPNRKTPRAPHRLSARLTRRVPALPLPAVVSAAVALSVLVWLPPMSVLWLPSEQGQRLLWPLMALAGLVLLLVLLPELAHYGSRRGALVLVLLGGMYLPFGVAVTLDTATLLERGYWVDTVVVSRTEPSGRGTPNCTLRELGGGSLTTTLSNCDHRPGDHLLVFADPTGETGARLSRPSGLSPERELAVLSAAAITVGAWKGTVTGYRRRKALGLLGAEAGEAELSYGRVARDPATP
ncbi:hypothetical protein [Streptomyces sp. CC219B]|uniref:hypothetical protein n=1 Tax=Streptomyces sp. CC219B TaxID=3044574 RepID=UPI0024A85FD8|nr:hypothetical protein [Streptomyces sp. CC219B]